MKNLKTILIIISTSFSLKVYSQTTYFTLDTFKIKIENYKINLSDSLVFSYTTNSETFYKTTLASYGYDTIGIPTDDTLSVLKEGFQNGELIKVDLYTSSCKIYNIKLSTRNFPDGKYIYGSPSIDSLISITGKMAQISVSNKNFCKNDNKEYPLLVTNSSFSSGFGFETIEGSDSILSPANYPPGKYAITYTSKSNECLANPSDSIEVFNALPTPIFDRKNPTCGESNGSIELNNYNTSLPNILVVNNQNVSKGLYNLASGIYNYEITPVDPNLAGCKISGTTELTCVEKNTFNPTSDLNYFKIGESEVKFDCGENVEIFNIDGQKIKTLSNSEKWNGRDFRGNLVNLGLYQIYCNGERIGEITIFN